MPATVELSREGEPLSAPVRSPSWRVRVGEREFAISADGFRLLGQDADARRQFVQCATSFRSFLDVWRFLDQETGTVRVLGHSLWPAQETYIAAADLHAWLYMLKARQLGETTAAVAYDAWVARFRDLQARVHVFSSGDDAAKEVLETVAFGLDHLPPAMRLPSTTLARSIRLDCGGGERAFIRSYPSTRAASRGATCNHLHADELSAMVDSRKVMQSISPTVAPGGTFHILTTETVGPESDTAAYFRKCIEGEGKHTAIFVEATARPDRDELWLEGVRRSMPRAECAREYPMTWEEALESAGDRVFMTEDIDACTQDALGCFPSQADYESRYAKFFCPEGKPARRYYSCGWDIGLKNDATVGCILDVTDEIVDLVGFVYMRGDLSVGHVERAIEDTFGRWPGCHVTIEANAIGYAIAQSVNIREERLHEFITTGVSKPRILGELQRLIELHHFRFNAADASVLDRELRGYTLPDLHISQDTVLSLAIALSGAEYARDTGGRILGVIRV